MNRLLKLSGIALVVILASMHIESCTKSKTSSNSSTAPGTAMFWMSDNHFVSTPVLIVVQGVKDTQSITQIYHVQPACSAAGCVELTLNPGTYNWSWVDHGGAIKSGVVIVNSNQCNPIQVN